MGYFKNTMCYGPAKEWHDAACRCAECRLERGNKRHSYGAFDPITRCPMCDAIAPEGQSFLRGLCPACIEKYGL